MKLVICHGATSVEHMLILLRPDGLKRPYRVVTMDEMWWEVAASLDLPRFFFTDKLRMMRFVLKHGFRNELRPVAVIVKDGTEDSAAMAASFHAMNAVELNVHQT